MGAKQRKIETTKQYAATKALQDGFDQVIYKDGKSHYSYRRTTKASNVQKGKIICYIRLFYKDGQLETRVCTR